MTISDRLIDALCVVASEADADRVVVNVGDHAVCLWHPAANYIASVGNTHTVAGTPVEALRALRDALETETAA